MSKEYQRWFEDDCKEQFSHKSASDFFRSEIALYDKVEGEIRSFLDVGCASGRLIEYLKTKYKKFAFTGVDLVPSQVSAAKDNYPEQNFLHGNALDMDWNETFDLINATGVMQHEPRFEELLDLMWELSDKYVLCDVKFANIPSHIVDNCLSYCGSEENRLYYILLNPQKFLKSLKALKGIKSIHFYGYITPLNDRTIVPSDIKEIYSAGVLLEKEKGYEGKIIIESDIVGLDLV